MTGPIFDNCLLRPWSLIVINLFAPLMVCAQVLDRSVTASSVPAAALGGASAPASVLQPSNTKPVVGTGFGSGATWQELNAAQRDALSPLAKDWDQLDSARKGKWLEVAARYQSLPPMEKARLRVRMTDWARMSPLERQQARIGFRETQKINADDLSAKWEAYQALPEEKRNALLEKAAKRKPVVTAGIQSTGLTKMNLVPRGEKRPAVAVAASVLQAKPGASTVLMTQSRTLPTHQAAGLPKVLASPDLVDPKTLLPKRPPANGF